MRSLDGVAVDFLALLAQNEMYKLDKESALAEKIAALGSDEKRRWKDLRNPFLQVDAKKSTRKAQELEKYKEKFRDLLFVAVTATRGLKRSGQKKLVTCIRKINSRALAIVSPSSFRVAKKTMPKAKRPVAKKTTADKAAKKKTVAKKTTAAKKKTVAKKPKTPSPKRPAPKKSPEKKLPTPVSEKSDNDASSDSEIEDEDRGEFDFDEDGGWAHRM